MIHHPQSDLLERRKSCNILSHYPQGSIIHEFGSWSCGASYDPTEPSKEDEARYNHCYGINI